MNPLFRIDFSISDSLKIVRKSVLIYETIIKRRSQKLPENFDLLLEQAIQLRKEVPERSVAQIICILELEGYAAPGVLKRSTLERHLYRAGYGREQMQMYRDARGSSSKRFCKPHRMMLVQGDYSDIIFIPMFFLYSLLIMGQA